MSSNAAKLLIALSLWAGHLLAQNCGTYTIVGNTCERYATFPWYATGQGWQSQVSFQLSPSATGAANVQFGLGAGQNLGLASGAPNTAFRGSLGGTQSIYTSPQFALSANGSTRLDMLNAATCVGSNCVDNPLLAIGTAWVKITAADAKTLDAASLQLIYLASIPKGDPISWQVAVPPIFNDQASPRWITTFSETPADQKAASVNSNNMAFAVANLSAQAQAVTISVYDLFGNLIMQKATPTLGAGTQAGEQVKPGDVYADTFANFFGLTLNSLGNSATTLASAIGTIDGTILFEGSGQKPIAPLVVRSAGKSNSLLLVTPLK